MATAVVLAATGPALSPTVPTGLQGTLCPATQPATPREASAGRRLTPKSTSLLLHTIFPSARSCELRTLLALLGVVLLRSLVAWHMGKFIGRGIRIVTRRDWMRFWVLIADCVISGVVEVALGSQLQSLTSALSALYQRRLLPSCCKTEGPTVIAEFSETLATLHSNTAKPVIDLLLWSLSRRNLGRKGPFMLGSYFVLQCLLRHVLPATLPVPGGQKALEQWFKTQLAPVIGWPLLLVPLLLEDHLSTGRAFSRFCAFRAHLHTVNTAFSELQVTHGTLLPKLTRHTAQLSEMMVLKGSC